MAQGSRPCRKRGLPGVRPLLGAVGKTAASSVSGKKPRRAAGTRTYEDCLVSCGESVSLWLEEVENGEVVGDFFEARAIGSVADLEHASEGMGLVQRGDGGVVEVSGFLVDELCDECGPLVCWMIGQVKRRKPGLRARERSRWGLWQARKQLRTRSNSARRCVVNLGGRA